jgi:hypothetical protein
MQLIVQLTRQPSLTFAPILVPDAVFPRDVDFDYPSDERETSYEPVSECLPEHPQVPTPHIQHQPDPTHDVSNAGSDVMQLIVQLTRQPSLTFRVRLPPRRGFRLPVRREGDLIRASLRMSARTSPRHCHSRPSSPTPAWAGVRAERARKMYTAASHATKKRKRDGSRAKRLRMSSSMETISPGSIHSKTSSSDAWP